MTYPERTHDPRGAPPGLATAAASSVAALVAVVWALHAAVATRGVAEWVTNSDQLTIPALVLDVARRPADFFGWQLSRSSYLFPDALSYAVALAVSHDALRSIVLAQIPVLLAWVYVVYRAAPDTLRASRPGRLCWSVALGVLFPLVLTQVSPSIAAWVTKYLFSFSNHFGAFVLGCLLLLWSVDYLAAPARWRLPAIALVSLLASASNRALWAFYLAPLAVALVLWMLRGRRRWRAIAPAAAAITGAVGGYLLEGSFNRLTVMPIEWTTSGFLAHAEAFAGTLRSYGAAQPGMLAAAAAAALICVLALLGLAVRMVAWWKAGARQEQAWLFGVAIVVSVAINVVAGMAAWTNLGNTRYLMAFFFGPVLLLRWVPRVRVAPGWTLVAVLVLACASIVGYWRWGLESGLAGYARAQTAALSDCLRTLNVGRGLANYWVARHLAFLSLGDIRVDQVSPGSDRKETLFFYLGNNAYDYLRGHPDIDPYDYVIADQLDPRVLRDAFGAPDHIHRCVGHEVWTYRDKTRLFAGLFRGHVAPYQRLLAKDVSVTIPAAVFTGSIGASDGLARRAGAEDKPGALIAGSRFDLAPGGYRIEVLYAPPVPRAEGVTPDRFEVIRRGGGPTPFVALTGTPGPDVLRKHVFLRVGPAGDTIQPRVLYSGTGGLRVEAIRIVQGALDDREIRLQADDPHVRTQVGVLRDGSILSTGKPGVLLYGPYLPLAAGSYRAIIHFATDRPGADLGKVDIATDLGKNVLAETPLAHAKPSGEGYRLDVDFRTARPVDGVEVRVFVKDGADLKVRGYEIVPAS
jgi:hypothetical protein